MISGVEFIEDEVSSFADALGNAGFHPLLVILPQVQANEKDSQELEPYPDSAVKKDADLSSFATEWHLRFPKYPW